MAINPPTMSVEKFKLPERMREEVNEVWTKTPDLSKGGTSQVVNLGAGVPNFLPSQEFVKCLQDAVGDDDVSVHQYSNSMGHPRLRETLTKLFGPSLNRDLDPLKEVIVTLGAKEALNCALMGMINPGDDDEIIVIEPCFSLYQPTIKAAEAKLVYIPLRPATPETRSSAEWVLSREELASKFTSKTKVCLVNTPNNPLGKVFSREELTVVADLCIKHDVVCISDEVYEWLVHTGQSHIRIATLPGMWERTITIGSAGKMLSVTGWRIGWGIGPAHLIHNMEAAHKATTLVTASPMQLGVARCLNLEMSRWDQPESYRCRLAAETEANRDRLAEAFASVGVRTIVPEGGYFLVADITPLIDQSAADPEADIINWLAKEKGLVVLPLAAFFSNENAEIGKYLIRLCIVKDKASIDKAEEIIRSLKN